MFYKQFLTIMFYMYNCITSSNIDWYLAIDTDDLCRSLSDFLITSGPGVECVLTLEFVCEGLSLPNEWESGRDFKDSGGERGVGKRGVGDVGVGVGGVGVGDGGVGDGGMGESILGSFILLDSNSPFSSGFSGFLVVSFPTLLILSVIG